MPPAIVVFLLAAIVLVAWFLRNWEPVVSTINQLYRLEETLMLLAAIPLVLLMVAASGGLLYLSIVLPGFWAGLAALAAVVALAMLVGSIRFLGSYGIPTGMRAANKVPGDRAKARSKAQISRDREDELWAGYEARKRELGE